MRATDRNSCPKFRRLSWQFLPPKAHEKSLPPRALARELRGVFNALADAIGFLSIASFVTIKSRHEVLTRSTVMDDQRNCEIILARPTGTSPRPYWIPAGLDIDLLPDGAQAAIEGILQPAYEDMVVNAPTSLERATGVTLVHLMWLEMIDQLFLNADTIASSFYVEGSAKRQQVIDRHLKLIGAKTSISKFLLRLRGLGKKESMEHLSLESLRGLKAALDEGDENGIGS